MEEKLGMRCGKWGCEDVRGGCCGSEGEDKWDKKGSGENWEKSSEEIVKGMY